MLYLTLCSTHYTSHLTLVTLCLLTVPHTLPYSPSHTLPYSVLTLVLTLFSLHSTRTLPHSTNLTLYPTIACCHQPYPHPLPQCFIICPHLPPSLACCLLCPPFPPFPPSPPPLPYFALPARTCPSPGSYTLPSPVLP